MLPLWDVNRPSRLPVLTFVLIAANVLVFVFWQPDGFRRLDPSRQDATEEVRFLYEHALVPCEVSNWEPLSPKLAASCAGGRDAGAPTDRFFPGKSVALSLLATMFLHANWLHLVGNVWFLWVFGDNIEDRAGRPRFLLFYLLAGAAASVGHVLSGPDSLQPAIGASGAVAGVLGAYFVWFPRARVVSVVPPLFFLPFAVQAWLMLLVWFVMQFLTNPESGVAWVAHVTGFGFGALVAVAGRRGPRARTVHRPDRFA